MNAVAEIWGERRTLAALVGRELRLRHAGSLGGLAWSVLVPLAQLLILTTVFSLVLLIRLHLYSQRFYEYECDYYRTN